MEEKEEYKEGDSFVQISFDFPDVLAENKLVKHIRDNFIDAVNIRVIKCKVYKETESFQISKKTNGITVYNTKHIKQPWEQG